VSVNQHNTKLIEKTRILVWIPTNFVYFGIAEFLQKQEQFEVYAIIDVTGFSKKLIFFNEFVCMLY